MNKKLAEQTLQKIAMLPRSSLGHTPTPLAEAPRLSAELGGPRIFFKRDDLTTTGLGGNKVRKLEFVIGRAIAEGADTLVVCGGFQSNLARIAAAMGSQLGLAVELVLGGVPGECRDPLGNLLLDHVYGASVHFVETEPRWEFGTAVEELEQRLIAKGKKPYVIPLGASSPEGMASYIEASHELALQLEQSDIEPSALYVPVGSGGTYCGLVLAEKNLGLPYEVVGISVSRSADYYREKLPADMAQAAARLELPLVPEVGELNLDERFIGGGYGEISAGCREAISLVARSEGILLDPVYSGKCMHGLIEHIHEGRFGPGDTVVFLHTGGWPALFSYSADRLGLDPRPGILSSTPLQGK